MVKAERSYFHFPCFGQMVLVDKLLGGFPGLLGSYWAFFPVTVDSKLPRVFWCSRAQAVHTEKTKINTVLMQKILSHSDGFTWEYPFSVAQSTPRSRTQSSLSR